MLTNKRILLTGSVDSSISLSHSLALHGASVQLVPMIEIFPVESTSHIHQCVSNLNTFEWIMFTSKYGVSSWFDMLHVHGVQIPHTMKFASVGSKTAEKLASYGYIADFVCSKHNGKDFAKEFSEFCNHTETRVLFPTGNLTQNMIALTVSPAILITKCIVYQTVPPQYFDASIFDKIRANQFDFIIFTSPSGVTNFVELSNEPTLLHKAQIISIGPSTTKRLQEYNCTTSVQAQEYTSQGIFAILQQLNT